MKKEQQINTQPAFPGTQVTELGLTKREYFTARAMQGLLSNPGWMKEYQGEKYLMQSDVIAKIAIQTADIVLEKLAKIQEP